MHAPQAAAAAIDWVITAFGGGSSTLAEDVWASAGSTPAMQQAHAPPVMPLEVTQRLCRHICIPGRSREFQSLLRYSGVLWRDPGRTV